MNARSVWLIGKSVLIEALRRREVYALVLAACALIGVVGSIDFFDLQGLSKFYREVSLKVMSAATALTVIVLAARQLPREFESRTIYPLLAKPISRLTFLFGKLLGVLLAAAFCFLLFMAVYVAGALYLGGDIPWMLFAQYVYLQLLMMTLLATLGFWLSMVLNLDAAITVGVLGYVTASTFTAMTTFVYELVGRPQQLLLQALTWAIPQLTLFDLSEKAVHTEMWPPLSFPTMAALTAYGLAYAALYFTFAALVFRRRPL